MSFESNITVKNVMLKYLNKKASDYMYSNLSENEFVFLNLVGTHPSYRTDKIIGLWRKATRAKDFDNIINSLKAKGFLLEDTDLEIYMVSSKGMVELKKYSSI